jgi:phosphatidate cytidylyltransferase
MSKLVLRLLLFFLALPALLLLAMWNWVGHLPLALLAVAISALGAGETAALLRTKGLDINPYLPYALGTLFPSLAYFVNGGLLTADQSLVVVALVIVLILVRQIFANTEENLQPVLAKVTGILFTLIYPGFFVYWILRINSLPEAWLLMPIFLLAVIGNDAGAWTLGSLFGKNSPKPFLVSPSKSVIGFIGGIAATFGVLIIAFFVVPGHLLGQSFLMVLALAAVLSLTTIVGDLFESSLKRSARVKDSGDIVPGRGGVLDSIDSLLFSAPVFYLFLQYGRF